MGLQDPNYRHYPETIQCRGDEQRTSPETRALIQGCVPCLLSCKINKSYNTLCIEACSLTCKLIYDISAASGEPPLLLAVSVHCATRAAIKAARKQLRSWGGVEGTEPSFQLDVPATMPVVKQQCGLDAVETHLHKLISSWWSCSVFSFYIFLLLIFNSFFAISDVASNLRNKSSFICKERMGDDVLILFENVVHQSNSPLHLAFQWDYLDNCSPIVFFFFFW